MKSAKPVWVLVGVAALAGAVIVTRIFHRPAAPAPARTAQPSATVTPTPTPTPVTGVALPIDGFFARQKLIGFGTDVTERFRADHRDLLPAATAQYPKFYGYHAAVDVEYSSPADANKPVPVRAVADGTVVYKGSVAGYGGLMIIRHERPESVTSLYGHVRLSDAPVKVGDAVTAGQTIAYLGQGFSADTSGERKHLHFGIHKGPSIDLQGYEQSMATLNTGWYDPDSWLHAHGL